MAAKANRQKAGQGGAGTQGSAKGGGGKGFYVLLGLVAAGGAAWLVTARGGGVGTGDLPTPEEFAALATTVEADPAVGIALGRPDAPVTILEFADYSCPACRQFASFHGRLIRQNYVEGGGPVRWVLYDYVLGIFPHSVPASIAARCAGDQGRYWQMHDLLLARQDRWSREANPGSQFLDLAQELGLDRGQLAACIEEGRHLESVAAARKYGEQMGVSSTPTIFFNGRKLDNQRGEIAYESIEAMIRQAVDSAAAAGPAATDAPAGGAEASSGEGS